MRRALAVTLLLVGTSARPADAHRVDEYLQATTLLVSRHRVQAEMRLAPGMAVVHIVMRSIDTDRDGLLSDAEQRGYAERVLADLSVSLDRKPVPLQLTTYAFPSVDELRRGLGEIQLAFEAPLQPGAADRRLVFENHHQNAIAAYLVNALAPKDSAIQITAQQRDFRQAVYELSYSDAGTVVSFGAMFRWALILSAVVLIAGRLVLRGQQRLSTAR